MKARVPYAMTNAQKKALDQEIKKRVIELDDEWSKYADATVMWTLHVCFGFGKKRLLRFWEACFKENKRLKEYYELPAEDSGWLYMRKLKDIGIDIEELYEKYEREISQS